MSILESILLGIIQGLTEFLPVSSSGHLEIAKRLFGDHLLPEESLLMTIVLHSATALSTIVVFRKDILKIIKGLFNTEMNEEKKFSLYIVISMIPAVFVGLLFEEFIESLFDGNMTLVGSMLILTAVLLLFADKAKTTEKGVTGISALIIGIAQAIAILPGISRSGATISTSVLLGIDRSKAARFSFLMVIPLILGKMAKDLLEGELNGIGNQSSSLIIGFAAAFISGFVACTWMINLVKKSKLTYFSIYCAVIGVIAIIFA